MREIKFRAHAVRNSCGERVDKYVFGDLTQSAIPEENTILDWYDGDVYQIERETVSQLIAVDKNGKEVYEGDKVKRVLEWSNEERDFIEVDGWPFEATFEDYRTILDGEIILVEV